MTSHGPARAPSTLARVREVFSSPGFRRLFATRAVSQIGDGMFQLATADLLLFQKPGPNPAVTLTLLALVTLVPFSVLSPFVGVFIDRWDRRKILEIVPIVRAGLAALIGLGIGRGKQGPDFYVLVLLILSANRFFLATISAVLPQYVPEDDLLVANSAASTGGSVANVAGLGLGAALSALVGGTRAAGASAVAFALGALLARRMEAHPGPMRNRGPLREEVRAVLGEMNDGFRRIRSNRRVSFALSAVMANQIWVGAMSAGTAVFFIGVLHLKIKSITSLFGTLSSGLAIGVVFVPLLARKMRHDRLIPLSFVVAGAAALFAAATLSHGTVVAGAGLVGLAYAMTKIPVDTIVQEEMPDSHRGRAFAVYDMLFNFSRVAGTALCALAVAASTKPRTVVLTIAIGYLVSAVVFETRLRRIAPAESPSEDAEPALRVSSPVQTAADLFPVGELVTVRTYSGHRADVEPRVLVVGGREIPVESVEWRSIEERTSGERRSVFVVRAAGARIRLSSSSESSRWEVERVFGSSANP